MTLVFPKNGRRRSSNKQFSDKKTEEKASSVCMTFGCGIFFLVCAMIGYFYMKAFELNGMILPDLLKVEAHKL